MGTPTVPKPKRLAECGCDWGECPNDDVDWRWTDDHGWLPVCAEHAESAE